MQKSEKMARGQFSIHNLNLTNFQLGQNFLIFDEIAKGKHSVIYYGIHKITKKERAFKFYNFKKIEEQEGFKKKEICKRVSKKQWQIMQNSSSIHVLKCEAVFENRDYKVAVLQYCDSSLSSEINNRKGKEISLIRAISILKQILSALKSLHLTSNQLHTLLKPEHFLVRNGIYKLVDFGLPALGAPCQFGAQSENFAPEIKMRKPFDSKAEVWTLGVLFHQILFGQLPSALKSISQDPNFSLFDERHKKSEHLPHQVTLFLKDCLYVDPQRRITWEQVESNPIFGQFKVPTKAPPLVTRNSIYIKQILALEKQQQRQMSIVLPLEDNSREIVAEEEERKVQALLHERQNMDQIQKCLQREIEGQYVKVGWSFEIRPLECTSLEYLKGQINKEEAQYYHEMQEFYLQCIKVDFIYHNIIRQLPETKERDIVQLKYLLLGSCFSAVSRLNTIQKYEQEKDSDYQNLLESCVSKATAFLYSSIKDMWNRVGDTLSKIQSKPVNIFFDKVRSFTKKEQQEQKNKFFNGIQNVDFLPLEKVHFTKIFFFHNRKQIEKQCSKRQFRERLVFEYLQIYDKIWEIEASTRVEERYPSLKQYVDREILKKFSSFME